MAKDPRKAELIAELARTRSQMTANVTGLRRDLDFPARARRAFARHPAVWIGGTALLGLMIAKLSTRPKKVVVLGKGKPAPLEQAGKAGLILGALKIAFDLARPALTRWVTHYAADYFAARHSGDRRGRG